MSAVEKDGKGGGGDRKVLTAVMINKNKSAKGGILLMKKKFLATLLAITLAMAVEIPGTMITEASEFLESGELSENPIELANISLENIDLADVSEADYNVMGRPYSGDSFLVDGISAYADGNTNPNAAYLLENNTAGSGTFTAEKEERWYAFILTEKTKVSIRTEMAAAMDADLYVFSLDSAAGVLTVIGGSANTTAGQAEYYSAVLEAGTYFVGIANYAGVGSYMVSYYQTNVDVNYEENDSVNTAANIAMNKKIVGVIDCPYDVDIYKLTVTEYTWIRMMGNFPGKFELDVIGMSTGAVCSHEGKTGNIYTFSPGTYWFRVSSKDGGYSSTTTYDFTLEKVYGGQTKDEYMQTGYTSKEGIEVKLSIDGKLAFVNDNMVDIRYSWSFAASCQEGAHAAVISVNPDASTHCTNIAALHYVKSSHPIMDNFGHGTVLKMTFLSNDNFYRIHWEGNGIFASEAIDYNSSMITVLIDPNSGKIVDIVYPNYYYDFNNDGTNGIFTVEDQNVILWKE